MLSPQRVSDAENQIEKAVSILHQGGLVAFPTDTLYALGAHAFIDEAIERVYQVKQRPMHMALPLLLSNALEMEVVSVNISQATWNFAELCWPGALTLILHKAPSISPKITAGGKTIAVRVPDHPTALKLIEYAGVPLTGTSANKSGEGNPITASDVRRQIGEKLGLILDNDYSSLNNASTIVDMTCNTPRIIRHGAIPASVLARICPKIENSTNEYST